jgi:hypothetical protein
MASAMLVQNRILMRTPSPVGGSLEPGRLDLRNDRRPSIGSCSMGYSGYLATRPKQWGLRPEARACPKALASARVRRPWAPRRIDAVERKVTMAGRPAR